MNGIIAKHSTALHNCIAYHALLHFTCINAPLHSTTLHSTLPLHCTELHFTTAPLHTQLYTTTRTVHGTTALHYCIAYIAYHALATPLHHRMNGIIAQHRTVQHHTTASTESTALLHCITLHSTAQNCTIPHHSIHGTLHHCTSLLHA
jgi:hypothetical protein